jgi:hypothetical protein
MRQFVIGERTIMRTFTMSLSVLAVLAMAACSPKPAASGSATPAEGAAQPTEPDRARVAAHLENHVKYPASRADILAACADTDEFTAGEKAWFEQRLPEGDYASASDVIAAIGQ